MSKKNNKSKGDIALQTLQTQQNSDKEQKRTTDKKALFLEVYAKTMGIITHACENADIDRGTFYLWRDNDPKFAADVKKVDARRIDMTEDRLWKLIQQDDGPTIRWFLSKASEVYQDKKVLEHTVPERSFTHMVDQLLDKLKEADEKLSTPEDAGQEVPEELDGELAQNQE